MVGDTEEAGVGTVGVMAEGAADGVGAVGAMVDTVADGDAVGEVVGGDAK